MLLCSVKTPAPGPGTRMTLPVAEIRVVRLQLAACLPRNVTVPGPAPDAAAAAAHTWPEGVVSPWG